MTHLYPILPAMPLPRASRSSTAKALVISDGSLAALVATAMVSEEAASGASATPTDLPGIVWPVVASWVHAAELWPACERAAGSQADLYGLGFMPPDHARRTTSEHLAQLPAGQAETTVLLQAAYLAAQQGCRRVLWPIQCRPDVGTGDLDLDTVSRAIDRAVLAGRIASLDLDRPEWAGCGVPEVRIETPFVDLTDDQLADLSRDLEVPVETCWWWGGSRGALPLGEHEASRWMPLVRTAAGVAEPKPPARTPAGR